MKKWLLLVLSFIFLADLCYGESDWGMHICLGNPGGYCRSYPQSVSYSSSVGSYYGGGGGSRGVGSSGTLYYTPNPGSGGGGVSSPFFPDRFHLPQNGGVNIFVGIPIHPKLDEAYHKALLTSLINGQSAQTKGIFVEAKLALEKYGSAESAKTGLSQTIYAGLNRELEKIASTQYFRDRSVRSSIPPGVDISTWNKPLEKLKTAATTRNPFEFIDGLKEFNEYTSSAPRTLRSQWQASIVGTLTNIQGVATVFPDAPVLSSLISYSNAAKGQEVRNSLHKLMAAEQVFEWEYRLYCEKNGESGCQSVTPLIHELRNQYVEQSFAHSIADRLGYIDDPAFSVVMSALKAQSDFAYGFSQGVYESSVDFIDALKAVVSHPIDTSKAIVSALGEAIVNYGRTYDAIKDVLKDKVDQFVHGTAEERGKVIGEATVEVISTLVPASAAVKGGTKLIQGAVKFSTHSVAALEATKHLANASKISRLAEKGFSNFARLLPQTATRLLEHNIDDIENFSSLSDIKIPKSVRGLASSADEELTRVIDSGGGEKVADAYSKWTSKLDIHSEGSFGPVLNEIEKFGSTKIDDAHLKMTPAPVSLPQDGWYARVMDRELAERLKTGEGTLTEIHKKFKHQKAFITAREDIHGITSQKEMAERLGLYDKDNITKVMDLNGYVIVEFKLSDPISSPLVDPLVIFKDPSKAPVGYVPGGRTSGGAREWLIDNDAVQRGLIDLDSIEIKEIE